MVFQFFYTGKETYRHTRNTSEIATNHFTCLSSDLTFGQVCPDGIPRQKEDLISRGDQDWFNSTNCFPRLKFLISVFLLFQKIVGFSKTMLFFSCTR